MFKVELDRVPIVREVWERMFPSVKPTLAEKVEAWDKIRSDYLSQPHTPDLITDVWSRLWDIWSRGYLRLAPVMPCPKTTAEIKDLEGTGKMLVYVHPQVSSLGRVKILEKLFDQEKGGVGFWLSYEDSDSHWKKTKNVKQSGWIDTEFDAEAPNQLSEQFSHLRRNIHDVIDFMTFSKNRVGLTINSYLIASEFARVISGRYFDLKTETMLLGSPTSDGFFLGTANLQFDRQCCLQCLGEERAKKPRIVHLHEFTYYWTRHFPGDLGIRTTSALKLGHRDKPGSIDELRFSRIFDLPPV